MSPTTGSPHAPSVGGSAGQASLVPPTLAENGPLEAEVRPWVSQGRGARIANHNMLAYKGR